MLDVASSVIEALDRAGVRYSVGGSLASSFSGEPRSSIDVDIVVDMSLAQVHPFVESLGDAFYADEDALRRAVTNRATTNLIHHASGIKVDIFVARSAFDVRQLERRQLVRIGTEPERHWFVHTPEDILLQKMLWYRQGGETSDRHGLRERHGCRPRCCGPARSGAARRRSQRLSYVTPNPNHPAQPDAPSHQVL